MAVVATRGHWTVKRGTGSGAGTSFGISAGSRIVWVLVQADVENTGVAFEAVLRPVTMMDVPVQNNNLSQSVFLLQVTGSDCNVVEQTETKCGITFCMMARRLSRSGMVSSSSEIKRPMDSP